MTKSKILLTAFVVVSISVACDAQGMLNKIKQKAAEAAEKELEKKAKQKAGVPNENQNNQNQSPGNSSNQSNNGNPTNKGGGGLVVTPPDVKQSMADAESSFKAANYSDARYNIKQAMLGVEMEIGKNVLNSLPETVSGLKKDSEADQVTSMGAGWVGLTIHREYENGDKQLQMDIANNSAWMSAYNAYMANANYASTGAQQNWKQTRVKGYKGIIEYSDASGYKLSVPIGQSSMIVWQGINFASEQEMMTAANAFDIDGIKKTLGEK